MKNDAQVGLIGALLILAAAACVILPRIIASQSAPPLEIVIKGDPPPLTAEQDKAATRWLVALTAVIDPVMPKTTLQHDCTRIMEELPSDYKVGMAHIKNLRDLIAKTNPDEIEVGCAYSYKQKGVIFPTVRYHITDKMEAAVILTEDGKAIKTVTEPFPTANYVFTN